MKQTSKVSIIIPVYNVEKYIDECFKSVLAQEHKNLEVIIVDDGSLESSAMICDSYAELDSRFRVIHKKNCGVAASRNTAMKIMSGEYCFYLDSDDVIETDSISYLVSLIENTDSDMALAVTRRFSGKYSAEDESPAIETIYDTRQEIIEKVLFDKADLKPLYRKNEKTEVAYEYVSTLYKANKLIANNIHFLPISYGEDAYVCFKSLLTSERVVTSTKVVYSYRKNLASTTFQYHPELLKETSDYCRYYIGLFEEYAPEYISQAEEGLDGQYLFRCLSSIEGELFYSPLDKPVREKIKTVRNIRNDKKFKKLFTFESMKYTSGGRYRIVLIGIKLRLYPVIICLISAIRIFKQRQ